MLDGANKVLDRDGDSIVETLVKIFEVVGDCLPYKELAVFAVEEEALLRVIEEEGGELAWSRGVWGGFRDVGVK